MKIRTVGDELFSLDGRTYTKRLRVAFRNFENAPKTPWCCLAHHLQFCLALQKTNELKKRLSIRSSPNSERATRSRR